MSYIGSKIGHIRIESRLGTGGMGEVYLGFDPRLERRVAVKTIRPEQRLSPQVKARFLREARLLSKIGHPSICQVHDLIETPEADFLVLEYVEGETLRQFAARGGLAEEAKLRLAEKIALALAAAHREKIVHRDLKADNVMVTPEGEIKVLDFGIARSLAEIEPPPIQPPPPLPEPGEVATHDWSVFAATQTVDLGIPDALTRHGMVVGTIQAMSPEQATGGEVTEASDLYSFGILLHELFTGEPAYEGKEEPALFWRVMRADTRPITGLDPDLTRLIQDLESLDPRRRPTAAEAAERLRWISDRPQRQRRRRLRVAASGAGRSMSSLRAGAPSRTGSSSLPRPRPSWSWTGSTRHGPRSSGWRGWGFAARSWKRSCGGRPPGGESGHSGSRCFWTLPSALRGRESTIRNVRGTLKPAIRALQKSISAGSSTGPSATR